jgi:hypothetical protein
MSRHCIRKLFENMLIDDIMDIIEMYYVSLYYSGVVRKIKNTKLTKSENIYYTNPRTYLMILLYNQTLSSRQAQLVYRYSVQNSDILYKDSSFEEYNNLKRSQCRSLVNNASYFELTEFYYEQICFKPFPQLN